MAVPSSAKIYDIQGGFVGKSRVAKASSHSQNKAVLEQDHCD